jgi:hypothetical protein
LKNKEIEDPMSYVVSYIHHAKKISEECGCAVVLDITQGMPKIDRLNSYNIFHIEKSLD